MATMVGQFCAISLYIKPETHKKLEAEKGSVPMAAFIRALLEEYTELDDEQIEVAEKEIKVSTC